ncbi:glycosyltransferase family 2 protein [Exiguobacterium sp. s146]|uniref:glycosyltransferase family 2 protein n=1 Tax=Exiguobacterium sp. s146 TaxID=2751223 RepID=UPI001BEA72F0|nr:glycosyltransferase family 2 protein [Exiguobacterium sp. s146]
MNKLSAVIIVKNEEKVIRRCLESIKDLVDEIVIVDTGSTDQTVQISREYTDDVYFFQWCDDFSAARNFGKENAKNTFILNIDADEYIDVSKISEYKEWIQKKIHINKAYVTKIHNFTDDSKVVEHIAVRIASSNLEYTGAVHEEIITSDVGISPIELYHTGYLEKTRKEKRKSERNLKLLKEKLKNSNQKIDHYYLAKEYLSIDNLEMAKKELINALSDKKYYDQLWVPFAWTTLLDILIVEKDYNNLLIISSDLTEGYPDSPEYAFYNGLSLLFVGELVKSNHKLMNSLEKIEGSFIGKDLLYEKILSLLWKYNCAFEEYETAIEILYTLSSRYGTFNHRHISLLAGMLGRFPDIAKHYINISDDFLRRSILRELLVQENYHLGKLFFNEHTQDICEYKKWRKSNFLKYSELTFTDVFKNIMFGNFENIIDNNNNLLDEIDNSNSFLFMAYPFKNKINNVKNLELTLESLEHSDIYFDLYICYQYMKIVHEKNGLDGLHNLIVKNLKV